MRVPAALLAALLLAGCGLPAPGPGTPTTPTPATPTVTPPTPPPDLEPFSGQRAYEHVRAQVEGPDGIRYRIPGTDGNREAARLIADHLAGLGWNVTWDHWNGTYRCRETPLHNVVAERAGSSGKVLLLGAHYDTRPIAEKDADPENRTRPIPGAGDGGSGVGVLLELARVMPPTADAVRLVFFDAEDGGDVDACTDWLLGSRHYAENLTDAEARAVRAMVLVDMVSDPDLRLPRELASYNGPGRPVQDRIWAIAHGLGHRQFTNDTRVGQTYTIEDDHVPFAQRGIPSVDLIHLVPGKLFPAWHHTQQDDMSRVSAESLEAVGRTLQRWLAEGAQQGP